MDVLNRFLKYVTFDTQSSETTGTTPSTPGQRVFAEALVEELKAIGLEEISLDENCYLMATLPANTTRDIPTIGFIAHLDTSPDMSGKDVRPRVVQYTGGNIVLNEQEDIKLSPMMFPELSDYQGQEIIVTDGTTLLGADDKAGVAAIIAAVDYLKNHPEKRADDLIQAFKDPEIDMILCAIGGDDTYRLLPYLFDNNELKKSLCNKIFLGFSDSTINHFMLQKVGLNTFYGQAFLSDICEIAPDMLPYTKAYFEELLCTGKIREVKSSPWWYKNRVHYEKEYMDTDLPPLPNSGDQLLHGEPVFSGKI